MVDRSISACMATKYTAGFLKRCAETANDTFTLVSHRLLHLFSFYDVTDADALTCLWPTYMLEHVPDSVTCHSKAARARMDRIWSAWQKCLAKNKELLHTDYPQAVGYFLDCHVLMVTKSKHKSIAYIMQHKLTPEQSTATLKISEKLHKAVSELWHNKTNAARPIIKLLQKGLPRPRSVRYIRPQVMRCAMCPQSKQIARELIINWMLGRYPHRKDIAGPDRRIEAWGQTFDLLTKKLLQLPSRSLYYVIAECLAAVTVSCPALHIRAVGTVPGFAQYVQTATTSACVALKSPTVRLRQCVSQSKLNKHKIAAAQACSATTQRQKIEQWPCNAETRHGQLQSTVKNLGLPALRKFACMHCNVLHVKIGKPPRAAKMQMGVSIDILNPAQAYCNKCDNKATLLTLSGHVTRAVIGKTTQVVSLCGYCGVFSNNLQVHGTLLCCKTCAQQLHQHSIDNALTCPCNLPNAVPSKHYFIAKTKSKYVLVRACTKHEHLAASTHSTVELSVWQKIFNA